MRILIVDDELIIRKLIVRILASMDQSNEMAQAGGCQEAKGQLRRLKFDVAFIDVNLGKESGLDLAMEFRGLDPFLRIVVMSGDLSKKGLVKEKGFGCMLTKPFTENELKGAILSLE
jgi:DNA-binding response OmpR family regulator